MKNREEIILFPSSLNFGFGKSTVFEKDSYGGDVELSFLTPVGIVIIILYVL
ncbi:MAG: hypothetical protein ABDK94_08895 [Atribacterota bacterium]